MSDHLHLSIQPDVSFRPNYFTVVLKITDPKMMGKKAEFKLDLASDVHDSRAVNNSSEQLAIRQKYLVHNAAHNRDS